MNAKFMSTIFLFSLISFGCRDREYASETQNLNPSTNLMSCCLCSVNHYADNWRPGPKTSAATDIVRRQENKELVGDHQNLLGITHSLKNIGENGCLGESVGYEKVSGFGWSETRTFECREVKIFSEACEFLPLTSSKLEIGAWVPSPDIDERRPVFVFQNPTTKLANQRVLSEYKLAVRGAYVEKFQIKKGRYYRLIVQSDKQLGEITYGTEAMPKIVSSVSEKIDEKRRTTPGLSKEFPYVLALENWEFILTVESHEETLADVSIKIVEYW